MFSGMGKVVKVISPYVFTRDNTARLAGGLTLTATSIGLNLLSPYIFSEAINSLISDENTEVLSVEFSPLMMTSLYATAWSFSRISNVLKKIVLDPIVTEATKKLVFKFLGHMMNLSQRYHVTTPMGNSTELLNKCFQAGPDFISQILAQVIPTIIEVVVAIVLLSHWYGFEIGASVAGILVIYTAYNIFTATMLIEAQNARLMAGFKTFSKILSILGNYESVHYFDNLKHEMKQLDANLNEFRDNITKSLTIPNKISVGQLLIIGLGFSALILFTANSVLSRRYSISDFVFLSYYLMQFSAPLASFGEAINKTQSTITDLESVVKFLELKSEVVDTNPNHNLLIDHSNAKITFNNVSFSYDETPILEGVTFTAEAGKKTGIVGLSGAGKSTLAKLLFRFYDPKNGSIEINDQDIKNVSLSSLRSAISIVPQAPVLFNDTLRYNIAYAAFSFRENNIPEEEILHSTEAAHLSDYIFQLPLNLNTPVGERGLKISGGQLQRVAIARAVLKDPAIYIFDEATSALDNNTAEEIQKNLDQISNGITTLIITHKLLTIVNADKIVVLDNCRVVEEGTHQQLILNKGLYATLWEKQSSAYSNSKSAKDLETPVELFNPTFFEKNELDAEPVRYLARKSRFFPSSIAQDVTINPPLATPSFVSNTGPKSPKSKIFDSLDSSSRLKEPLLDPKLRNII